MTYGRAAGRSEFMTTARSFLRPSSILYPRAQQEPGGVATNGSVGGDSPLIP
jgi:hypothetical protein